MTCSREPISSGLHHLLVCHCHTDRGLFLMRLHFGLPWPPCHAGSAGERVPVASGGSVLAPPAPGSALWGGSSAQGCGAWWHMDMDTVIPGISSVTHSRARAWTWTL